MGRCNLAWDGAQGTPRSGTDTLRVLEGRRKEPQVAEAHSGRAPPPRTKPWDTVAYVRGTHAE